MAFYYVDSSALVKRYILETGSEWVLSLFDPRLNNTANSLPPVTFVSADNELNPAAASEGLIVENPNNYP
jgi:hypothetical protein